MNPVEETAARIDEFLQAHPGLADRLSRQFLIVLHNEGLATIDAIYDEARRLTGEEPVVREEVDPNRPSTLRWAGKERDAVREVILRHAASSLPPDRVVEVLNLVHRREEAESLETIANIQAVPFHVLAESVRRFSAIPRGDNRLPQAQTTGLRVALTRNFISDQLEFIAIAKNYLRVPDFQWILDRVIGPERGQGRIGGKAAGMFLGYRILQGADKEHASAPEALVHLPESWFLRSDVIEEFLRLNGLGEYQNQKYKDAEEIRNEYPLIRQVFHNAEFPKEIAAKLERLLEGIGPHPLIVRSSSLLEDRFGAAFSGMYASVFLGNQGTLRDRLRALIGAIVEVYASTLGPNPLLYRRRHNLIDYNEDMAILIQKVVGRRHGRWFLPDVAGVAFSRNEYRWSPRIRPEDGVARIVLGLGTRAVDRTGNDYPRMVPLGAPRLRPEITADQIQRYSQRYVDAIDLEANGFLNAPLSDLMADGADVPGLEMAASIVSEDAVLEPTGSLAGLPHSRLCLTFDRLLGRTRFPALMRDRLRRLEDAYGVPINVEFAQVGDEFYLLQCRPLVQAEAAQACRLPSSVRDDRKVFSARGVVRSGEVRDIGYVVFVDPHAYDEVESLETRAEIGRAVARVNDALEGETYILLGPGRWGSNDSRLGVRVNYADINRCRVLIEIAVRKGGFVPEVSYGTHFFQDLVEDGIYYLALYPGEEQTTYRESFFTESPNALASIAPRDAELSRFLKVIRVADAAGGDTLHLVMDGEASEALCWLE